MSSYIVWVKTMEQLFITLHSTVGLTEERSQMKDGSAADLNLISSLDYQFFSFSFYSESNNFISFFFFLVITASVYGLN